MRELVDYAPSPGACAIGDCTCIIQTLSRPRATAGPRSDRIPPTRPSWWRRQFRELKKFPFSAPSTCPIDLFGPLANGRILKRLHARGLLVSYTSLADQAWLQLCSPAECVSGEPLLQVLAHLEHRSCLSQPSVTRPSAGDNLKIRPVLLQCKTAAAVLLQALFLEHCMPGSHG